MRKLLAVAALLLLVPQSGTHAGAIRLAAKGAKKAARLGGPAAKAGGKAAGRGAAVVKAVAKVVY